MCTPSGYRDSLHGLELKRVYVYVGETQNLQRRLDEHLPEHRSSEPGTLRAYLRKNYTAAMCWYLPTEASQCMKAVQNELIRKIQPQFNTVGL